MPTIRKEEIKGYKMVVGFLGGGGDPGSRLVQRFLEKTGLKLEDFPKVESTGNDQIEGLRRTGLI